MPTTAFGPQGPNYSTTRPPADPKASAGIHTFFKNCSAAGAKDGTFATADFFNVIIANLRYLCETAGVTLDDLDDTMIWQAVHNMVGGNSVVTLTAPQTFYVNGNTGSDANTGLTPATAFQTIQKAADTMANWNLNGFNITVNVADNPSYANFVAPTMAGSGTVFWIGNTVTPGNVVVTGSSKSAIIARGQAHYFNGFKVQTSGAGVDPMYGIGVGVNSAAYVKNIEYGACSGAHNFVAFNSTLRFDGTSFRITGGSPGNTYSPGCFVYGMSGATVDMVNLAGPPALTLIGTPAFGTAFVMAQLLSNITLVFASITGTATGPRYRSESNSVINSAGGGASYYPGNAAGVATTGLYL